MGKIAVLICLSVFLCPFFVLAHPPSRIDAEYDDAAKELKLDIIHPVEAPKSHFIYRVTVDVDGKRLIDKEYDEQTDDMEQQVSLNVPGVEKGSTIDIEAFCNRYGEKKGQIRI